MGHECFILYCSLRTISKAIPSLFNSYRSRSVCVCVFVCVRLLRYNPNHLARGSADKRLELGIAWCGSSNVTNSKLGTLNVACLSRLASIWVCVKLDSLSSFSVSHKCRLEIIGARSLSLTSNLNSNISLFQIRNSVYL